MKKAILTALLCGAAFGASPVLAAEIAIAVHTEPSSITYQIAEHMKQEIESRSGGKLTVAVLGQEVGGERDQVEGASTGEYQVALGGSVPMALYAPKYAASDLPFVWDSSDEAAKIYKGALGDKIQKQFAANGNLRLLGISLRNPRDLTSNKPIKTPDDVKGVRMRVPEIKTWIDVWTAEGALPSPIAWPEVYTSLKTGVIEMQENPVENIYSGKIYEVQKYVDTTQHVYSFYHWLANNQWYQGLSDEDRKIVQDSADAAIAWGDNEVTAGKDAIIAKLKDAGMQFVEPDRAAFREKAAPVIRKIADGLAPDVKDYVLSKLN